MEGGTAFLLWSLFSAYYHTLKILPLVDQATVDQFKFTI